MLSERDQVAVIVRASSLPYENLRQTLALGLLVLAKHDYAEAKHGEAFSEAQLAAADDFTPAQLSRFRETADGMLTQFAVVFASPRANVASSWEHLKNWLWGFGQGYAAAVAWSVSLVGVAILIRYGGGDLIDILAKWIKPGH